MKWIKIIDQLPSECTKVLAVYKTEKDKVYNMRHYGWFRDTIYSCRYQDEKFIIESHGPIMNATHWTPTPELPNEIEMRDKDASKL